MADITQKQANVLLKEWQIRLGLQDMHQIIDDLARAFIDAKRSANNG